MEPEDTSGAKKPKLKKSLVTPLYLSMAMEWESGFTLRLNAARNIDFSRLSII